MEIEGQMDKEKGSKPFDWLPIAMPGVARLVRERRAKHGDAHVNECFRRGVLKGEPGWFFAREGSISIGVLEPGRTMPEFESLHLTATQATLVMRDPAGAADGAH